MIKHEDVYMTTWLLDYIITRLHDYMTTLLHDYLTTWLQIIIILFHLIADDNFEVGFDLETIPCSSRDSK